MRLQMRGERVERLCDTSLIAEAGGRAAKPGDPGRALLVVSEEPMHIGSGNAPVRRDGAVDAAILKASKGRCKHARAPHMHFVAMEGHQIRERLAGYFRQRLLASG